MARWIAASLEIAAVALCASCGAEPELPEFGYLAYLDRPATGAHVLAAETSGATYVLPLRLVNAVYVWGPLLDSEVRAAIPDVSRVTPTYGGRLAIVEVSARTVDSATAADVAWMLAANAHSASFYPEGDTLVAAVFRIDSVDALLANPRFTRFTLAPITHVLN